MAERVFLRNNLRASENSFIQKRKLNELRRTFTDDRLVSRPEEKDGITLRSN